MYRGSTAPKVWPPSKGLCVPPEGAPTLLDGELASDMIWPKWPHNIYLERVLLWFSLTPPPHPDMQLYVYAALFNIKLCSYIIFTNKQVPSKEKSVGSAMGQLSLIWCRVETSALVWGLTLKQQCVFSFNWQHTITLIMVIPLFVQYFSQ
jgi:hypothetical protein